MDLRCFTDRQVDPILRGKPHTFDAEGLALDETGRLYVCDEADRWILGAEPESHRVLAECEFSSIERVPEHEYRLRVPLAGLMEGLAVDGQYFWLVTDNNNLGRVQDPKDTRPTLFRCPRP